MITEYDLSNSGFSITFDYARGESFFGVVSLELILGVDENIRYTAAGLLSAVDPVGRAIGLEVILVDAADPTYSGTLFANEQVSIATPNEMFTLGQSGGDYDNANVGSLTGTLIAGHVYEFLVEIEVAYGTEYPPPEPPEYSDATFSGNVSLSFSAIPEPSTAALLVLGLVGISATRRRRAC